MDDPKNTAGTVEADEDILTPTVSDDALEAAAGGDNPQFATFTDAMCPQCRWPGA